VLATLNRKHHLATRVQEKKTVGTTTKNTGQLNKE